MVADISSLRNVKLPRFDVALFANIIHGSRDTDRLLKGAKRLLKPSGHIVVMNWNVDEDTPRGPLTKTAT
jgi:ubiquinone/menaquinone biosynthesis C-methylase UbiE